MDVAACWHWWRQHLAGGCNLHTVNTLIVYSRADRACPACPCTCSCCTHEHCQGLLASGSCSRAAIVWPSCPSNALLVRLAMNAFRLSSTALISIARDWICMIEMQMPLTALATLSGWTHKSDLGQCSSSDPNRPGESGCCTRWGCSIRRSLLLGYQGCLTKMASPSCHRSTWEASTQTGATARGPPGKGSLPDVHDQLPLLMQVSCVLLEQPSDSRKHST